MIFYLGSHMPHWLGIVDVPLFVSHRRLMRYKTLPRARGPWALDSGGFTEIAKHGRWMITPTEYIAAVRRYRDEIGNLRWAAPQDWMCEDMMLAKTGLTVAEHQARTTANYLELRSLAPDLPFVPVIQGQTLDQYRRHTDAYAAADIDLTDEEFVGIGSVCRRQSTNEISGLVANLTDDGLRLHGFGMKVLGLRQVGQWMYSADSMAWSFQAVHRPVLLPGHTHKTCANCLEWALRWRDDVLRSIGAEPAQMAFGWAP